MTSQLRDLESIIRGPVQSTADVKPHLMRLSHSLKERLRDKDFSSITYVKDAVRLISRLKGEAFSTLRFEALSQTVPYLYAHGSLTEALLAARAMRVASTGTASIECIRRAENYLGIIHEGLGNVAQAVIHYHRALVLARECGDRSGEISVLTNLGAALTNGGLYREAIPCFAAADRLCAQHAEAGRPWEAILLANLALALSRLGDSRGAYIAMSRCISVLRDPTDAQSIYVRTNTELTFVQIALDAGKIREAKEHAQACVRYASMTGAGLASFNARLADGLVNVYAGDLEYGLAQLEKAQSQSNTLEFDHLRPDSMSMLVRAYEQCRRPREALQAMRQLLQHISARREAAVSALLSLDIPASDIADATGDLQTLRLREAELRAATAELETVNSAFEMLERLAVTASLREDPSGQHGYRVGRLSALLAQQLGWNRQDCFVLESAARLHDIGKVAIPDRILLTSEELKDEERRFIQYHTTMGAELLSRSDLAQLRVGEEIARHHHEWWDGSGYPSGIVGSDIPIHARIVALADVFDALTHGRPYARAWSFDEALLRIRILSGRQFDPALTEAFILLVTRLRAECGDLDAFLKEAALSSPFLLARENLQRMLSDAESGAPN